MTKRQTDFFQQKHDELTLDSLTYETVASQAPVFEDDGGRPSAKQLQVHMSIPCAGRVERVCGAWLVSR